MEASLSLYMTADPKIKRQVDGMIVQADAEQFADPVWWRHLSVSALTL